MSAADPLQVIADCQRQLRTLTGVRAWCAVGTWTSMVIEAFRAHPLEQLTFAVGELDDGLSGHLATMLPPRLRFRAGPGFQVGFTPNLGPGDPSPAGQLISAVVYRYLYGHDPDGICRWLELHARTDASGAWQLDRAAVQALADPEPLRVDGADVSFAPMDLWSAMTGWESEVIATLRTALSDELSALAASLGEPLTVDLRCPQDSGHPRWRALVAALDDDAAWELRDMLGAEQAQLTPDGVRPVS